MDIKKLTEETILKNMTPEQQKAVLESVMASVKESKQVRSQKIAENVDLVMQALKKIEAQMLARLNKAADTVETVAKNVKDGKDGRDGKDGKDGKGLVGPKGADGRDGKDGKDGKDGRDGVDGVSVINAFLDFDNSLVIELSNGKQINVGGMLSDDAAEKVRVVANGGGTSQGVLDAIAALQTAIATLIPSQTGNSGKFLTTNGSVLSWGSAVGGLSYQGTWNASTNSPTLTSSVGTNGYYYVVGTAGSTNLNGITDWQVGDWVIYNGSSWQKLDQTNLVTSVAGRTGDVTLSTSDISGLGTIATQAANNVAITGGNINGTTIGGTTAAAGTFTNVIANNGIYAKTAFSGSYTDGIVTDYVTGTGQFTVGSSDGFAWRNNGPSSPVSLMTLSTAGSLAVTAINSTPIGSTTASTGAFTTLSASSTVSGTGFSTYLASPPAIGGTSAAAGTFTTLISNSTAQFGKSSANYVQVVGAATTLSPVLSAQGSDTNISQVFQSKGTGAIDLAAGSSGVNISNGGTVTAITRTAGGSGYATAPTVTVSPPTTAGGVQATATCTITGGVVDSTFTITNAGSGYVEQPTVSFSGGGGSGAAAYATVGSATVIKTLGSTTASTGFSFQTPAGEQVRISDPGNTTVNFISMWGGASGVAPRFVARGADTDVSFLYSTKGAGSHVFRTADTNTSQFQITHTASAVNYVQVTGAATGNGPVVSSQGSDAAVNFTLTTKGTGAFLFATGNNAYRQFQINDTTNAVNNIIASGSVAGSAPAFSVRGTDTNIDLALTPKGTGKVTTTADINAANVVSSAGLYAKAAMTATYTDGIVTDYTTGLGRVSVGTADGIAFYNAGVGTTELMRLDSSGNLLVGTTSLTNVSTASNVVIRKNGTGVDIGGTASTGAVTIRGLSTGAAILDFANTSTDPNSSPYLQGRINYDFTNNFMSFLTNGVNERMRIDSSGNLLVGASSALTFGGKLQVTGPADTAGFNCTTAGTGSQSFISFYRNGSVTGGISNTGTTTAYNTSSDYRLKENVQPMQGALDIVAQLKPVTYTWKSDGSSSQGFIAHELQEIVPDCVTGEKDAVDENGNPKYQGIDTSFLVATLTAAIQEQQAMIQQLQSDIAELKNKV